MPMCGKSNVCHSSVQFNAAMCSGGEIHTYIQSQKWEYVRTILHTKTRRIHAGSRQSPCPHAANALPAPVRHRLQSAVPTGPTGSLSYVKYLYSC